MGLAGVGSGAAASIASRMRGLHPEPSGSSASLLSSARAVTPLGAAMASKEGLSQNVGHRSQCFARPARRN